MTYGINNVTYWRTVIKILVTTLHSKAKSLVPFQINLILHLLEQAYEKYIEALVFEDNITYSEFYNLVDILDRNIKRLTAKAKQRSNEY